MPTPKTKQLIEERPETRAVRRATHSLTTDGREILDPKPMEPPLGYNKQPSMIENIRNMIRSENLRQAALKAGAETFEEADDFGDDEDDPEHLTSPYESTFDPIPSEDLRALRGEISPEDDQRIAAALTPTQPKGGSGGGEDEGGSPELPPSPAGPSAGGLAARIRRKIAP